MQSDTRERALRAGRWTAIGAAAAVVRGSTPSGIAMVAAIGAVFAWRSGAGASRARA